MSKKKIPLKVVPVDLESLDPKWRERAACRDVGPSIFYPDKSDHAAVAEARSVCAGCPVKPECFMDCAETSYNWQQGGIRAGLSTRDRRVIKRAKALQGFMVVEGEEV